MTGPVVIAGNNLAAMVAAQAIAAAGRDVVLINPAPAWGAHFGGMELAGRRFDPGMVLYEFDAFNTEPSPDPLGYDARARNDCGRFAGLVGEYVAKRVPTVEIPGAEMMLGGKAYPDMIISNRIEALAMLDGDLRTRIRAELAAICAAGRGPLHASRKTLDPVFAATDCAAVSVANHGRLLHDTLFEPVCRKITGVASAQILALYHRTAWLPLYYPETLLSQFGPAPQALPATAFHYPADGASSSLVRALAAELLADAHIRVVRSAVRGLEPGATTRILLEDGSALETTDFVWTLDPSVLASLASPDAQRPEYSRATIGLCFMAVPAARVRRPLSTLFVIDPQHASYRVTDQEGCAHIVAPEHRLVAEFCPAVLEARGLRDPQAMQQALLHELAELGVIDGADSVAYCSLKILHNALMIPNAENRTQFNMQLDWLAERLPGVHLAGPSAAFHAGSMNDQIVQGLRLAARLGTGAEQR